MLVKYIIYFGAGLLVSLIGTYTIKSISQHESVQAGLSSFFSMFVSVYIVLDIVSNIQEVGFFAIFFYALGDGIGTYYITKYKVKRGSTLA